MSSFWDSFQVYNPNKHAKSSKMGGGNHSNLGSSNTQFIYSKEHRPSNASAASDDLAAKAPAEGMKETSNLGSNMNSEAGTNPNPNPNPNLVDVSQLSQGEFERIYKNMRKGEPNNKVNF
ncbi:hypothetical protein TBLA_0I01390 [Henningerozyma blattae CBS 6284]|uniref:Stationary phase protein 4 n=1 Tax=Henningerozyma blattae (strain ATCC 34711 / CBS 6284 / DSM 70876 / NBRC 10599 / NRRL Y-10934 / UCD 77-7) TaxID=1071380 RepID=I2H8U7_HENB6|nr:hypothetical protein TBLA_0I01390 [Tetrapisispora blattae CBS 6284]CCH62799.1 hypothetical protein TBLA_0I01390 [Tetrapisispora blattae CBS 6284]